MKRSHSNLTSALLGILLLMAWGIASAAAERSVLFVVDASGSMWGQVEGRTKIEIAREVMGRVVDELPVDTDLGLLAYGHRRKADCADIELISTPGASRADLRGHLDALNPKGKTPIGAALDQAVNAMRQIEGTASIVLLSDGLETCGADPCAIAAKAAASGVDLRIHVIGFDLGAGEASQLQCIADNGRGRFFSAANAEQLATALSEAARDVRPEPEPEPPATGQVLLDGNYEQTLYRRFLHVSGNHERPRRKQEPNGWAYELPPGSYTAQFGSGPIRKIEVRAGEVTRIPLGRIELVFPEPSQKLSDLIDLFDNGSGERVLGANNSRQLREALPVGRYRLVGYYTQTAIDDIVVRHNEVTRVEFGVLTHAGPSEGHHLRVIDAASGTELGRVNRFRPASYLMAPGRYHLKTEHGPPIKYVTEIVAGEEVVITADTPVEVPE